MIKKLNKNVYKMIFLGLAIIALVGCSDASEQKSDVNEEIHETEVAKETVPPKELVKSNVESTDVTVALEMVDVSEEKREGIYVSYNIKAKIINSYKGKYKKGDEIEFYMVREENSKAPNKDEKYIISFIHKDDKLIIPDVAYDFIYSEELDAIYENVAKDQ